MVVTSFSRFYCTPQRIDGVPCEYYIESTFSYDSPS